MKAWAIVALFVLYLAIAIYGCYVTGHSHFFECSNREIYAVFERL
jgi:hypothetical protein